MTLPRLTIFAFSVENIIDVVTNSSSELFVFKGKTREIVEQMILEIYPEYHREYLSIKRSDELTVDELDTFIDYSLHPNIWPTYTKHQYPLIEGFTFDELYEPDTKAWNGRMQYKRKWRVTENTYMETLNKLDPDRKMYFLFSIDDNPDWDMQEQLMKIGDRYHLG